MFLMHGKITAGLGQAGYFLSWEGYRRQFPVLLGFLPFPGTLSVLPEEPFPAEATASIQIRGFCEEKKSFGGCHCYRLDAIAIRPKKSRHPPEMIEIIAPMNLRRGLNLKDGDRVDVLL
jgi:riboflavin kinase